MVEDIEAEVFNAAKRNDLEKVKMFIEKGGVSPTIQSEEGTLVHVAIKNGYLDMVKYLMEKDSSFLTLEYYQSFGVGYAYGPCTLLEIAIEHGRFEIVKYLVEEQHADIYQKFHFRLTAINWAVKLGNLNITKYFIEERNVDVNKPQPPENYDCQPILFDAVENKQWDIIKYLIEERKADLTVRSSNNNENILFAAVATGNLKFIRYILDERKTTIDINEKNDEGYTMVHIVTINNAVPSKIPNPKEILEYLIGEKHADFDIADGKEHKTPLHHAAESKFTVDENKSLEVLKYLIDCGADVGKQDINGDTALHVVVSYTRRDTLEACKYLCEHSANVNQKNKKGETPLDIFVAKLFWWDTEICKVLINHGANMNATDKNGNPLLHIAAMKNQMKLLEYLVCDKKHNVNTPRETDNWTPLHCAAFWNHFEICKYLIEHGADIRAKDKYGNTPAQLAPDQKLIDYIGNISTTGRNRRSVENYFPAFLYHSPTLEKITYPENAEPPNENAIGFLSNNSDSGLQNSFSHISLLMKCFFKPAVSPIYGSVAEILQDRMDPVAENAVDNFQ